MARFERSLARDCSQILYHNQRPKMPNTNENKEKRFGKHFCAFRIIVCNRI